MSDENMSLPGRFAVYGTVAGKPAVVARFEDNDVWLTQKQLADLFNTTWATGSDMIATVNYHSSGGDGGSARRVDPSV